MSMKTLLAAASLVAMAASAQAEVKIGMITTLSGGGASLGIDTRDGFMLAMEAAGRDDVPVPRNYFTDDDPSQPPLNTWRGHGHLIFSNWINNIYQNTPFDIGAIGKG